MKRFSTFVYGLSMVCLYSASGLFHALPISQEAHPLAFRFFQRLDMSAIYILIAGTNTPIIVMLLRGFPLRASICIMWMLAFSAVLVLWILEKPPHYVIVIISLSMGWIGILPMVYYYRAVGSWAMNYVWVGGILYSLGATCELTEWPENMYIPFRFGSHEVFHVFSSAGSFAFYFFISRHVIPYSGPDHLEVPPEARSDSTSPV